jgi:photosynthetic reaction center cytochrome c subunit
MRIQTSIESAVGRAVLLVMAALVLSACERPPVDTEQKGYRGLGIVQNINPRTLKKEIAENVVPVATPMVPAGGPTAGEVFKNVEVLGDLSVGQFTRLMTSITEWVAPEQGCAYCHSLQDLASDELYTKQVARAMIKMTRDSNQNWQSHVGGTGVTCYTCHRGNPVPAYVWSEGAAQAHALGINATMQNIASKSVGYTSLPFDPLTAYLGENNQIRVVSDTALPAGGDEKSIKQTEKTYGLMMYFSDSLGVNCTYCHNSRSFLSWDQSPPQRATAWHAIRHVREINGVISSLSYILPGDRKGVLGDPYKVGCKTCHQGIYKPLFGANMLKDYPSLAATPAQNN